MKGKRIAAVIGIVVLVGMYLVTLVAAVTSSPSSPQLFKASLYCTMVVPVLLYGYQLIYRVLKKYREDREKRNEE